MAELPRLRPYVLEGEWYPIDYDHVVHSPDDYGVCEVTDEGGRLLFITSGVVRDGLWHIHTNELPGARRFRFRLAETDANADQAAGRLARERGVEVCRFPPR